MKELKPFTDEELREAVDAIEERYDAETMLTLMADFSEQIGEEIKRRNLSGINRIERLNALCKRFVRQGIADAVMMMNALIADAHEEGA